MGGFEVNSSFFQTGSRHNRSFKCCCFRVACFIGMDKVNYDREQWLAFFKELSDARIAPEALALHDQEGEDLPSLGTAFNKIATTLCERRGEDPELMIPAAKEAREFYKDDPDFQESVVFIKYDKRREGNLKVGSAAPNSGPLHCLDAVTTKNLLDFQNSSRPLVVSAGSYT